MSARIQHRPTRRQLLHATTAAAVGSVVGPLVRARAAERSANGHRLRPSLCVTAEKVDGLRSLDELRESIHTGHGARLWQEMIRRADADLQEEPLHGGTRNYDIVNKAGGRVMRHALACLISDDTRYRDAALAQIDALFDPQRWPNWKDENHPESYTCGLRHGMLSADLGLAYDWLYTYLTDSQRQQIVEGIDRYAIRPYFQAIREQLRHFVNRWNNVTICIRGGLGLAGMGLGDDHPRSQELIDLATEHMSQYDKAYGPEGSYNESVGYAVSTMDVVRYFEPFRYWCAVVGRDNPHEKILGESPYPEFCRWMMYMTLPPGREACLGSGPNERRLNLFYVPAIASAAGDGILQWYYLNNLHLTEDTNLMRRYAFELLWYDPSIEPIDPEGRLPHGHAFRANNMCISSRTDWNPRSTACVVYGKGGVGYSEHNHYDAGQVCIDGHGQRLITDHAWHATSVLDHNILMFDGQDMIRDYRRQTKILAAEFDDRRGGTWWLDTSALYDGVERVTRRVIHLNPGIVVVLDQAELPKAREVSLRWHTISKAEPDDQGRFLVHGGQGAQLAARMVWMEPESIELAYHQERRSGRQHHRCETATRTRRCRILSLFCVFAPHETITAWDWDNGVASIDTPDGVAEVTVGERLLAVRYTDQAAVGWSVPV